MCVCVCVWQELDGRPVVVTNARQRIYSDGGGEGGGGGGGGGGDMDGGEE